MYNHIYIYECIHIGTLTPALCHLLCSWGREKCGLTVRIRTCRENALKDKLKYRRTLNDWLTDCLKCHEMTTTTVTTDLLASRWRTLEPLYWAGCMVLLLYISMRVCNRNVTGYSFAQLLNPKHTHLNQWCRKNYFVTNRQHTWPSCWSVFKCLVCGNCYYRMATVQCISLHIYMMRVFVYVNLSDKARDTPRCMIELFATYTYVCTYIYIKTTYIHYYIHTHISFICIC